MYIIGGLEDQISLLIWEQISNFPFRITTENIGNFSVYNRLFSNFINPLSSSQPITYAVFAILASIFGLGSLYIFTLITLILNFYFSYRLFKRYKYPILFSLIFCFSSYLWTHLGRHVALMQIWVFPLLINNLINMTAEVKFKTKLVLKSSLTLLLIMLVSNYYGLYSFIITLTFSTTYLIIYFFKKRSFNTVFFAHAILSGLISTLLIFVFLQNYLKNLYITPENLNSQSVRTLGDFYVFSAKPQYFFITPEQNPIYKNLNNPGASLKGFSYFQKEHEALFLGFLLTATLLAVIFKTIVRNLKKLNINEVTILITIGVMFLLMLPPEFHIFGTKVTGPSYLIFKYFKVFRSSSRLIVPILLLCLYLLAKYLDKFDHKKTKMLIIILTMITLIEVFIPIKLQKIENRDLYLRLNEITKADNIFAVYPYSSLSESLYWLPVHKRLQINLRYGKVNNIESEEFTDKIPTEQGLQLLRDNNVDYLVVYKDTDKTQFFLQNTNFELISENENGYIFKLNY